MEQSWKVRTGVNDALERVAAIGILPVVMTKLLGFVDYLIANEEDAEKVLGIRADDTDVTGGRLSRETTISTLWIAWVEATVLQQGFSTPSGIASMRAIQ